MNLNKAIYLAASIVTVIAGFTTSCHGQIKVINTDEDFTEIIQMTVSPAAAPKPLFRRRLTYLPTETVAGNAATVYMHSLGENVLGRKWKRAEATFGMEVYDWSGYQPPQADIPLDKLKQASAMFDDYINMNIERASRRRNCDWGFGFEDLRGPMVYGISLNGLQDTRSISRTLALQTKLAILESDFDRAIDLMRMNYRLAEHAGKVDVLVGNLIAVAEVGITNGGMIDFIAAPNSPNMYWALSELPDPLVNVRDALRMECNAIERIFPEMATAATTTHSDGEWSRIVQEIPRVAMELQMQTTRSEVNQTYKLVPALMGIMSYGPAKERLVKGGYDAQAVNDMAVGQVLLIDAHREYREIADVLEKEIYTPFHERKRGKLDDFMRSEERKAFNSFGKILALMILPAVEQVRAATVRVQRDIHALRLIEALRMHADETGSFPTSLDEVIVAPVPNNPATAKPFRYQRNGKTAIIELPRSDGFYYSKRFELTLRK